MKKPQVDIGRLVGRLGAPTGLRPAGAMRDRRTRRNRTRSARNRRAIADD